MDRKRRRARKATLEIGGVVHEFEAPGFKKVLRGQDVPPDLYWAAADDAVAAGYPTKTVPIDVDFSNAAQAIESISVRCRELQFEMLAWLDGERDDEARLKARFDGTIRSLADCYESDPDSGYATVQANTAQGYISWLKMVRDTVGARLIARVAAKDTRRWYREWKALASRRGSDGVRSAYGGIQVFKILLNYGIECGIQRCRQLRSDMEKIRFPRNPPRDVTITFAEAKRFVIEALRRGWKNLALAQAVQFECFLRQKDVIGAWQKVAADYIAQPGEIVLRGKVWRGTTMDMITLDADLKIRTSKTGQPVVHKTSACQLVVLVLAAFGPDEWKGPVACRPDGTPFPDRQSYAKAWRKIAKAVGISDEAQNMDNRASAVSEAAEAGVATDDIQRQTGHSGTAILDKTYKRLGSEASQRSHEARRKFREKEFADEGVED
jgi:hypothetical protein